MKSFTLFFVIYFILGFIGVYSQDSLLSKNKDSIEISKLILAASKYRSRNIDSAEHDALNALRLSKAKENLYLQGLSNKALGAILTEKGGRNNLLNSIEYFDEALIIM